ncbi:MAG: carboxymuconolactone decarboxylase family protein, partial [Actinomycetota bacterium]
MAGIKDYPAIYAHMQELMGRLGEEHPTVMKAFGSLHQAASADGELDVVAKELIALGIAIAVHCDGCISFHVHDARAAGASRKAIVETIGVAILMGG